MNFGGNFDFYGRLATTPFDFEATEIFEQNLLHQICDIPTRYATTAAVWMSNLDFYIYVDHSKSQ